MYKNPASAGFFFAFLQTHCRFHCLIKMGNILIIGASGGIGLATALQLQNEGHNVYGTYFKNEQVVSEYPLINWLPLDLSNLDSLHWIEKLPEQLDGLFYAVGKVTLKPFNRISLQDFLEDYKLQTLGAIHVVQQVLSHLKKSNQASVVFCSSVASQIGFPFHALIGSSKGAIEGVTKSLAAEYAPTIRFNAIAPSITATKLTAQFINSPEKRAIQDSKHPMKRIGETEDVAQLASFLLSNKSAWMTGQIIPMDGGISAIK